MRVTSYPDNHWRMQVEIPFSMGVMDHGLFMLCGQADLKGKGEVQHAHDLYAQTQASLRHILNIVEDLDCSMSDLAKLVIYYVNNGETDELTYIEFIAEALEFSPLPAITMVPLKHFFYPGLMVEIDAFGFVGPKNNRVVIPSSVHPFSQAVKQNGFTLSGAVRALDSNGRALDPGDAVAQSYLVQEKIDALLQQINARREDIVKVNNWFVGVDNTEIWSQSAKVRADWYPEPGPVATGMPLHAMQPKGAMIQTEFWTMQDQHDASLEKKYSWPDGHWDWPIHLPFKHGVQCGGFIFVGGQVSMDSAARILDPDDMPKQTITSMENLRAVLSEFGADFEDIIKMNCFYQGGGQPEELHCNLEIRAGYFKRPGPASTGIPLNNLCYPGMVTEFEAIATIPRTT
ncbi:MAG: RidA family protein [Arenicellales bacterium]